MALEAESTNLNHLFPLNPLSLAVSCHYIPERNCGFEDSSVFSSVLYLKNVWFVFPPVGCHWEKTLLRQRRRLSAEGHSFSFSTSLVRRPLLLLWLNDNTTSLPDRKRWTVNLGQSAVKNMTHSSTMKNWQARTHTGLHARRHTHTQRKACNCWAI